jgi:hypothetical protein
VYKITVVPIYIQLENVTIKGGIIGKNGDENPLYQTSSVFND